MQAFDSGVLFLVVAAFIAYLTRTGKRENGLPPGPPTLPVLGNILSFPREYLYLKLSEWATQYGGIYSLKLGSGTMIVLSSATTVKELLDQRSAHSIDRPESHLAQIVSDGLHFAFARHDGDWRVLRKGAHTVLTPQAAARHIPIEQAEATQLMYDLMREPEAFLNHLRRYANSVISSVIVGKRSPRFESEHASMFFEYDERWDAYLAPGASPPVDMFPILKYLPEFLAPWKKEARALRRLQRHLFFTALEECEERLRRGEGNDCYLEELIQQKDEIGLSRDQIAYLAGVLVEGGSGTSAIFLKSFILALISYPEAQRKAQEEIDAIVGHERTPLLADYDSLPYIRALVQEVHRTRPVAPLTLPHATTVVQEYKGYVIPEGATIFLNAWGIYHDPDAFDEPEAFNPDRYIKSLYGTKDGYDDTDFRNNFGFGSGRRICPGQVLANNSIAINAMNLIWAFNFVPPSNNRGGKPYDIENYLSGLSCTPRPFECTIVPRSAAKKRMIEREFSDAIRVFENFESTLTRDDKEYIRATRTSR
ncbi:cytochrome P450 [Hymenopellis radicata]|nr:cytochrome P450 [Hymenopellis radicata]